VGPVLGAVILIRLTELTPPSLAAPAARHLIVYGTLIVLISLARPKVWSDCFRGGARSAR